MMNSDDAALRRFLSRIDTSIARLDAATLDLPHIVHVFDAGLDVQFAFGPFLTPIAACAAAEHLTQELADDSAPGDLHVTVIPLELT